MRRKGQTKTVGIMIKPTGAPQDKTGSRLFVYSLGLIFQRRVRKILSVHGWSLKLGLPFTNSDAVAVWGRKGPAKRGMMMASVFKKPLLTVEDAFLRSVLTGRQGAQSLGIVTDWTGIYFDTSQPSDIDVFLEKSLHLNDDDLKNAADQMAYMGHLKLSKYNDYSQQEIELNNEYILVVDQTLNDAAIIKGGADAQTFVNMLAYAKAENPDKKIYIKTHPETAAGKRLGHYTQDDCDGQVDLLATQLSPYELFQGASKIYCVTSQVGLEAIFSGRKPIIFGRPFYAGLGLTDDRGPTPKSTLKLKPEQLFWATHLQYSKWYDPFFERATGFQTTATILHTKSRQHNDNKKPAFCIGMRLWKRGFLKQFLSGSASAPRFFDNSQKAVLAAKKNNGRVLVWSGKETQELHKACVQNHVPLIRVEDGFLRSVGLGAELVAPVSLAFDDTGIYYDPTRSSQLERLINASGNLSEIELARAKAVQNRIVALKMTKYNLAHRSVTLNAQRGQQIILVPGQVEDDASILKGAAQVKTNLDLLQAARVDFPDAYIVFKPHPDVEAGLRKGSIPTKQANDYADFIASNCNMADLLDQIDRIATITSLAGFEGLMRGKQVTCYGNPFYSCWGLTDDRGNKLDRRIARPKLTALIHACLIEYPRYWDPVTHNPCPIEVVVERFEKGEMQPKHGGSMRLLAKLQGVFASYAHLWR
jgi:capsular polysaccharide export protein